MLTNIFQRYHENVYILKENHNERKYSNAYKQHSKAFGQLMDKYHFPAVDTLGTMMTWKVQNKSNYNDFILSIGT